MEGDLGKRIRRAGAILLLGWLVLEIALIRLLADQVGWGIALLAMVLKGGFGLAMLFALTLRGLARLKDFARGSGALSATLDTGFGVASAVLVALPGFLPAFFGLALFVPAIRARAIALFRMGETDAEPGVIDLGTGDWAEAPGGEEPRRDSRASLETKPPSV